MFTGFMNYNIYFPRYWAVLKIIVASGMRPGGDVSITSHHHEVLAYLVRTSQQNMGMLCMVCFIDVRKIYRDCCADTMVFLVYGLWMSRIRTGDPCGYVASIVTIIYYLAPQIDCLLGV